MKKLSYQQVESNILKIAGKTSILYDLYKQNETLLDLFTMAIVNSINENIEPSWKGEKVEFIYKTFILGNDSGNKKHSFEIGDIHKCVQDCGESINILIDGEFVEIFKESIRLVGDE